MHAFDDEQVATGQKRFSGIMRSQMNERRASIWNKTRV